MLKVNMWFTQWQHWVKSWLFSGLFFFFFFKYPCKLRSQMFKTYVSAAAARVAKQSASWCPGLSFSVWANSVLSSSATGTKLKPLWKTWLCGNASQSVVWFWALRVTNCGVSGSANSWKENHEASSSLADVSLTDNFSQLVLISPHVLIIAVILFPCHTFTCFFNH